MRGVWQMLVSGLAPVGAGAESASDAHVLTFAAVDHMVTISKKKTQLCGRICIGIVDCKLCFPCIIQECIAFGEL